MRDQNHVYSRSVLLGHAFSLCAGSAVLARIIGDQHRSAGISRLSSAVGRKCTCSALKNLTRFGAVLRRAVFSKWHIFCDSLESCRLLMNEISGGCRMSE